MKRVYVCGSFKFLSQIEELEEMLRKENVVYIVDPDVHIGQSVSVDFGCAYARNKLTCLMHPIHDLLVMNSVKGAIQASKY